MNPPRSSVNDAHRREEQLFGRCVGDHRNHAAVSSVTSAPYVGQPSTRDSALVSTLLCDFATRPAQAAGGPPATGGERLNPSRRPVLRNRRRQRSRAYETPPYERAPAAGRSSGRLRCSRGGWRFPAAPSTSTRALTRPGSPTPWTRTPRTGQCCSWGCTGSGTMTSISSRRSRICTRSSALRSGSEATRPLSDTTCNRSAATYASWAGPPPSGLRLDAQRYSRERC